DGASDSQLYVGDGSGNATVTLSHAYAEEGNYFMSIGAQNLFDPTDSAATFNTALVADAALTPGTAIPVTATEGVTFTNAPVATFTDTDPGGTLPSDYQAQINWGDGQTSLGTIASIGGTSYSVSGTHAYAEEGNYPGPSGSGRGPVVVTV